MFSQHKHGLLQRIDARAQLMIYVGSLFTIPFLSPDRPMPWLIMVMLLLVITIMSGRPLFSYLKKMITVYPMILMATFFVPFQNLVEASVGNGNGIDILFTFAGLTVYQSGLERFLGIQITFLMILWLTFVIPASMPQRQMFSALACFKVPDWVLNVLHFSRHFVHLLWIELKRVHRSYKVRYVYLPLWRKVRVISGISAVYLTRILERSDRVYLAMRSRGFEGRMHYRDTLSWRFSDSLVIMVYTSAIIAALGLSIWKL